MAKYRKKVNIYGIPHDEYSYWEVQKMRSAGGVFNTTVREPVPEYNDAESETVYKSANNSWIILGRDRSHDHASGYGGMGHTQSGAIDIVAGLGAPWPREYVGEKKVYVNKSFKADAARVYISQKTDVDVNFNINFLSNSQPTHPSQDINHAEGKSAVAIKADHVRLIGREKIKLVTKTDAKNSQGGDVVSIHGIDLIAENRFDELQPMVKGDNLVAALKQLTEHVEKLNGIVYGFVTQQLDFNARVVNHQHITATPGALTPPSIPILLSGYKTMLEILYKTGLGLMVNRVNFKTYRVNYLTQGGESSILSRYNNVN